MRTLLLALVLVALVALGVLYALGVFTEDPDGGTGAVGGGGGEGGPGDVTPSLTGPPPEHRPPLEEFPLEEDVNVLLLVGYPQRFNAFLAQQWSLHPRVTLMSWAAPPPATSGTGPPAPEVLPGAWAGPPGETTLDDEDVDVVVLHDLDPKDVDDAFWQSLARRVAQQRVGLLVIPSLIRGRTLIEHEVLGSLLPVARARRVEGQPIPGAFSGYAPFEVTTPGQRHPAVRLVPWTEWSRRIWSGTRLGDAPWGTPFCYPVDEIAEGAEVLLRTDPEVGDAWPAMIVAAPAKGRVLWFGATDLGADGAYRQADVVGDWRILVRNWLVWLAGLAPEEG